MSMLSKSLLAETQSELLHAGRKKITLDRLFALCVAHGTPLTLDYAPPADPLSVGGIPAVYVRVGGIGVGWFAADGLDLHGAVAEWIGRLERRRSDRDE